MKLKVNNKEELFEITGSTIDTKLFSKFPEIIMDTTNWNELSKLPVSIILQILNSPKLVRPPIKYLQSFVIDMCQDKSVEEKDKLISNIEKFGFSSISLKDLMKLELIVNELVSAYPAKKIYTYIKQIIQIKKENKNDDTLSNFGNGIEIIQDMKTSKLFNGEKNKENK